jgi:hypothetical protein
MITIRPSRALLLLALCCTPAVFSTGAQAVSGHQREIQSAVWRCQHDTERAGRTQRQWERAYGACVSRETAAMDRKVKRSKKRR